MTTTFCFVLNNLKQLLTVPLSKSEKPHAVKYTQRMIVKCKSFMVLCKVN